jgi:hypothetical protein
VRHGIGDSAQAAKPKNNRTQRQRVGNGEHRSASLKERGVSTVRVVVLAGSMLAL